MRRAVKRHVALAILGFALALLAFFIFVPRSGPAGGLDPDDAGLVQRGAELYATHCAVCHGARLDGQPEWRRRRANGRLPAPPHDQSGHTWHHPDEILITITKHGPAALAGSGYESDMPAYAGVLSDADIRAVLSFIKSTWPPEIRQRHDEINARAHAR